MNLETHCRNGHERTPENTYVRPSGSRQCRACHNVRCKVRRAAKRDDLFRRIRSGEKVTCPKGVHVMTLPMVGSEGDCLACRAAVKVWRYPKKNPYADVCRNGHPRSLETTGRHRNCLICDRIANKALFQRTMADPVRAEAYREAHRFRDERRRRGAGVPERNWSPESLAKRDKVDYRARRRVDPQPFLGWLDGWLKSNPDVSEGLLAERAGSASRTLLSVREAAFNKVNLSLVDRYLLAANESPCVLDELYPFDVKELDACVA